MNSTTIETADFRSTDGKEWGYPLGQLLAIHFPKSKTSLVLFFSREAVVLEFDAAANAIACWETIAREGWRPFFFPAEEHVTRVTRRQYRGWQEPPELKAAPPAPDPKPAPAPPKPAMPVSQSASQRPVAGIKPPASRPAPGRPGFLRKIFGGRS